jgi:SNF2-related domain
MKRARKDTIKVDGIKVGLFPHQAYAIFWMLSRLIYDINGCFLADDMGVGKTMEFLGVWVIHRMVHLAWDEVQICRNSPDALDRAKHLPVGHTVGSSCPTDPFCISCPCQEDSISYQLSSVIRKGPVLILAPPNNVSVWEEECHNMIDTKNTRLKLEWHVAYGESRLTNAVIKDLQCDIETLDAKPGQERHLVIVSYRGIYNRLIEQALQYRLRRKESPRHPITWSIMGRDEFHTAKGSKTQVNEYFCLARTSASPPKSKKQPAADTASKKKKTTKKDPMEAYAAPHIGRPLKIAISGTPFEGSPSDLAGHLKSFADAEWNLGSHVMYKSSPDRLITLAKSYQNIVSNLGRRDTSVENATIDGLIGSYPTKLTAFLNPIMLRRTGHDKFFDYTIINLDPMRINQVACGTSTDYVNSLQLLASEAEKDLQAEYNVRLAAWQAKNNPNLPKPVMMINQLSKSNAAYFLRLAADFAAIPELHKRYPDWTFYADEAYQLDWDNVPKTNLYIIHLDTLVKSGKEKLDQLKKLLHDMRKRSKEWAKKGEKTEKMIIATAHPAILLILHLYFQHYEPKWKVTTVSSAIQVEQRNKIIGYFCGRGEEEQVKYHDADILLSTAACVGSGLNMTAANNFVLFDPLWMVKEQRQAFARVHRTGQKRQTHLTLLYAEGNPIERDILKRQQARTEVGEMTWKVSTGEMEKAQRRAERKARREQEQEATAGTV